MRNFNNIRTIDLREYLPEVLKDVQEMRAIMEAETPEVQAIWDACEAVSYTHLTLPTKA